MYKLAHQVGDQWIDLSHPAVFALETTDTGSERLKVGVPGGDIAVLRALLRCLTGPLFVLYVLHTTRGEGEVGRYQSPLVEHADVENFIADHADFWSGDGRFDLWIKSSETDGLIVWDRHNFISAYGPLAEFRSALLGLGFSEGCLSSLPDHLHHYRAEFDNDAAAVLSAFDWIRTDLRPGDEQFIDP